MLRITIPGDEYFDDEEQKFVTRNDVQLDLEHSLVSMSKWESTWEKPFLGKDEKTDEETLGYVIAMSSDPYISPETLSRLTTENIKQINAYIDAKMTATWFNDAPTRGTAKETITAELVYYWMITLNIPMECQHWHLNRLFTLIKVFNKKNAPAKKMSKQALAERNRQLNAERKARFNTSG